jgi:GT2 family glycosyltransferase
VESIVRTGVARREDIIVVENASDDDSTKIFASKLHGVRLVCAERNNGFSAGINLGAKLANLEFILVLNPDTYFIDNTIHHAFAEFDARPEVGLVGLNLINPDGTLQYSARRFYSALDILARRLPIGQYWPLKGRIAKHLMVASWQQGASFDADWVMGTGFIIRREIFERIGRMDESYFLYMEDVDLCARVWKAGYHVICVPDARLVHDHQRSSATNPFSWAGRMHLKSLLIFRKKYRVPMFRRPDVEKIYREPLSKSPFD